MYWLVVMRVFVILWCFFFIFIGGYLLKCLIFIRKVCNKLLFVNEVIVLLVFFIIWWVVLLMSICKIVLYIFWDCGLLFIFVSFCMCNSVFFVWKVLISILVRFIIIFCLVFRFNWFFICILFVVLVIIRIIFLNLVIVFFFWL